jgi:ATP-binding cassette, subfamily B, bacterial IrtB/YbtQ
VICACALTNLTMLLPFCVTVMIFSEILTPVANGGNVQWNHIWLLWGVGIISALLVFLAAKNDRKADAGKDERIPECAG